jgi:hypothetical protein
MENGKSIKKIKITKLEPKDVNITLGKTYSVIDSNSFRAAFINDAGHWDVVGMEQFKIVEAEKSFVGRYLKVLDARCKEHYGIENGDYLLFNNETPGGYQTWGEKGKTYHGIDVPSRSSFELMPEGFEPSEDMAINNFMEEGLRFRDEFQKELNEIDNAGIFNKITSNKPPQYNIGIDTFERMRANATYEEAMGFIRWNIDKYNTRQKGQDEDDYKKIISYAQEALWWIKNNK